MITLKEHLNLYAAARGIPVSKRNETVNALVFSVITFFYFICYNLFDLVVKAVKLKLKEKSIFFLQKSTVAYIIIS